ncbi:unnamed protein product [Urochloa humidicola]
MVGERGGSSRLRLARPPCPATSPTPASLDGPGRLRQCGTASAVAAATTSSGDAAVADHWSRACGTREAVWWPGGSACMRGRSPPVCPVS